jgi:hypothetical protein
MTVLLARLRLRRGRLRERRPTEVLVRLAGMVGYFLSVAGEVIAQVALVSDDLGHNTDSLPYRTPYMGLGLPDCNAAYGQEWQRLWQEVDECQKRY